MEENTENPYAAPAVDHSPAKLPGRSRTMINQIRIVAICMIIQGLLELLFSAYMIVMSFLYPRIMEQAQMNNQQMPAEEMEFMNTVQHWTVMYFIVVGGLILLVGSMRLCAGILNFQYRARKFGIAANFIGVASIVTCYCLPTGIAVCVYGSIILFHQDVIKAFQMKSEGSSDADILEYFNQ